MYQSAKETEILKPLKDYFQTQPEVLIAYLFGSVAKGLANKLSDIDVAVLVDENLAKPVKYGYQAKVLADLMKVLGTNHVDLVLLNRASPLLAYEVVREGQLIFCGDHTKRIVFETDSLRRYVDTAELRRIQAEYLGRRIAEGKFASPGGRTMYNAQTLRVHIEDMESAVLTLKGLRRHSLDEIKNDREVAWAIEHGLQVTIQNLLDIGSHILSAERVSYDDYTQVIDRLGERGIIPEDFAVSIRAMAGLRNILVHEYIRVESERIHRILQESLGDFTKFVGFIRDYLARKGVVLG